MAIKSANLCVRRASSTDIEFACSAVATVGKTNPCQMGPAISSSKTLERFRRFQLRTLRVAKKPRKLFWAGAVNGTHEYSLHLQRRPSKRIPIANQFSEQDLQAELDGTRAAELVEGAKTSAAYV